MVDVSPTAGMPAPRKQAGVGAWLGQAALYALFALVIGTFSHWPVYHHLGPDEALIKLSLVHTGQPISECRERTPEELEQMPPNMRTLMDCPRERSPITVELDINGEPQARVTAEPSGLSRDGAAAIYRRLQVPAGSYDLRVRLSDSAQPGAEPYVVERRVDIKPAQVLVIDFSAEHGEITLQ